MLTFLVDGEPISMNYKFCGNWFAAVSFIVRRSSKEADMKKCIAKVFILICLVQTASAQLDVTLVGDTTKIWDQNFAWSCGGVFFPMIRTANDTIYLTECDTLDLATCSCNYTICTSFIGLSPGTYTAVVTRLWKFHFYYPEEGIDTLMLHSENGGSVTFTVLIPPVLPKSITFYQSGCLRPGQVIKEELTSPNSFMMLSNYPNPFNPSTVIRYTIPFNGRVKLSIFNSVGQLITTLLDEHKNAGTYETILEANGLVSGVYFCCLSLSGKKVISKIVLLK